MQLREILKKEVSDAIRNSTQDLDLQIRSEFPFNGAETYFEAYPNTVRFNKNSSNIHFS